MRKDNYIEKTYFFIPPFCLCLDEEMQKKFENNAVRISLKGK